jgi:NADH-quinone oxidoreductase subunit M
MGVCTLGFFRETICGIEGAIFLMLSHGFVSGALFLCIGIIYDRYHVREIRIFHGLAPLIPLFAIYFFMFTIANLALPASSSFVGEFIVLLAVFQVNSYVGFFATTGVILSAAYSLWLYNRIMFGQPMPTTKRDLDRREFSQTFPLAVIVLLLGVYPSFVMSYLHVPVRGILYSFI